MEGGGGVVAEPMREVGLPSCSAHGLGFRV